MYNNHLNIDVVLVAEQRVSSRRPGVLRSLVSVHHVQSGSRLCLPNYKPQLLPRVAAELEKVPADEGVVFVGLSEEPFGNWGLAK